MDVLLFTYPNCSKCEELKKALRDNSMRNQEYDLTRKESKLKIREFLKNLKRDEKGAILIPTLIVQDGEQVCEVLNSKAELEAWLKSRE